jgi:hypothetical protein
VFFAVLSLLLLAANVTTSLRIRALAKLTRSRAVLVNDLVSSAGILALVAIPWVLGGLIRPGKTSHGRSCCHWLRVPLYRHPGPIGLHLSKMEAAARVESRVGATGEARRPTEEWRRGLPVRGHPQGPMRVHRTPLAGRHLEYTISIIPLD